MKKLINQTGLACPFLSRKLTYLTLLLVSLFGGGGSAWADPVYRKITSSEVIMTSSFDALTTIASGWVASGFNNGTADRNKTITPNVNGDEECSKTSVRGLKIKNAATTQQITLYVTGITEVNAYFGINTSNARTVKMTVNATGDEHTTGDVTLSSEVTTKLSVTDLIPNKEYTINISATNDACLYALKFIKPSLTGSYNYQKIYIGKGSNTYTLNNDYFSIKKGSDQATINTEYTMSYALTSGSTVSVNETTGATTSTNTLGESIVTATVTPKGTTADTYSGFTFPFTYVVTERKSNETGENGLTALDKAWTWTPEDVTSGRYYQDYHAGDGTYDYIFVKSSDTRNNGVRAKLQAKSQIAFKIGTKMDVTISSNKVSDRHLVISTADNSSSVVQSGNDNVTSHTFTLEADTYYVGAWDATKDQGTQLYIQSIQFTPHLDFIPADFSYGYTSWTSPATDEMTITIPAHKAGQDFNVTVNPGTYSLGTITNGSKNGNNVTITAPASGSNKTVTIPVTDGATTTDYQIVVTTETATGTAFNEKTRYSKLLIEARKESFYANTTAYSGDKGISSATTLDYVPGLVAKAMIDAVDYYKDHQNSEITNDLLASWYNYVKAYGSKSISDNGKAGKSFDDLNATKIYFGLKSVAASGKVTGIEAYSDANTKLTSALSGIKNANTSYSISSSRDGYPITIADMQGGWWHKADYINQMWGDGQYMGTALLAQLINDADVYDANNESKRVTANDWNVVANQIKIYHKYAWDSSVNLPHHAFAADKGTNSTSHSDTWKMDGDTYHNEGIWGRAAGWYFMALVDVLEQMPSSHADYNTIKGYLSAVASGLKARQDATTGCWYQLPLYDHTFSAQEYARSGNDNTRVYNYLESSATALYTAAYFKAIRLGLLDKATYEATAKKAYQGIIENFMSADNNLYWCCKSAGLGGKGDSYKAGGTKFRDGSNAYYLKGNDVAPTKPGSYTEGKVLGAFIMAATEYERAYLEGWTIRYGANNDDYGTVTSVYTSSGENCPSGTMVDNKVQTTITATPNLGYKLDMTNPWSNATGKHENPLIYTHDASRTFIAKFIPLEAPTISAQTIADATYKKNSAATALSVTGATSENGNLSYQWYSNTSNTTVGGTLLNGETGTTFTPQTNKNVGTTYYYCEVTETVDKRAEAGSKAYGTAICYSDIAKITIAADDCGLTHSGTIYGAIDQTTPYRQARTDVFELKEGEKKVFRFTNHGNSEENWHNWNVAIVSSTDLNSATDDMVMRSDAWGWGKFYNLQPEIKQDGSSINWKDFKNDMNNADVEVEIDYNASTKIISITATSKGSNHTYVETATTNATSGTKGVYFFVDQSHFCNFRELVSIKATASDGCTLNSVVANDVNIGNENNVTYFVEPNSKVVITTTPTSDKYLRTWNVVGTQGEASKVGDQDIYTINTLATNTTVIAKYGLKSSETLPHPENSNYEETGSEPNITYTITLPAFSHNLVGKEQTVALNLPEYATAAKKEGEGRIEGDNLIVIVQRQDDTKPIPSITITVTAQDGSHKDYIIKYPTTAAPSYDFVVNAVTSRGGKEVVLKEITSGNASSVIFTHPQYILDGTTLYNIEQGADSPGWYRKSLPIDKKGDFNITYNQFSDGRVIYYTEGEDIPGMTRAASSNVLVRASNGAVGYNHEEILVTTIPAGAYTIHARGLNGNSEYKTATFKAGDQSVYELTINTGNNNATGTSQPFYVDKETEIYVSCTGGNSSGLDWFYIEKATVLPVTINGQTYTLSKDNNVVDGNINKKDLFFNVSANDWNERTVESKNINLYNLGSSRYEDILVKGAKAFEVITQNASGSDRTYKVSINETDWNTIVTAKAKTTASSGIFATDREEQITIRLSNASGTVYPYQIIFYTEKPKGELTSSETELKVTDKSHAPIELATNSGGNISMTTVPSTVAEYAEVSFDQQTKGLSITPVKVGTFTLDFSIAENGAYAAGTSTYTVNIRKEQLTMTITPDEGYSWNKTTSPDSQPQLTQPTIVLKDEAGQVVNGKVLTYTSDDPTVATIDGTVIKLAAEPQGSANIYIAFAGDDDYEEVSGIYPILIEQGVSHKFDENTFGGNGPAVGLEKTLYDVKEENGAWVDDTTKPLVYYTFGGWKWGKDGDKNDHKYEVTDAAGKTSEKSDSWTEPALFSGSGGTKPIYVDGYKYAASGAQDAMDESKLLSESPVFGKKRNGWFQSENDDPHIRPFTLPVRGSYIKYDPQVNGYLTVYLLQNGAFNTETGDDGKSYLKVGEFQPHAFHVVDQNGTPVPTYTDFTFVVKEKVTQKHKDGISISCSYEGDKVTKDLDNGFVPNGFAFDEHDVATWPMFYTNYTKKERQDIKDAWSSGINGAQKVVKLHNGSFFLTQKAYVKYTFYVAAGQTYYIFSNFSKIGMSGINFVKDAEQPDQENDVLALNDNASFPTLKDASTNVSKKLSIPQYGKITVNRSFKKDTWNTICLPFNMTEREVIENFGNDVQILCFDGTEVGDNTNTLHFVYHEIQSILAGYPYLIRPSKDVNTGDNSGKLITVYNKMIQPKNNGTPQSPILVYTDPKEFVEFSTSRYWNGTPYVAETEGAYTFKGTIGATTQYNKGDIYMSGTGELKRMTGESSNLKGYRAYLKSNNTADAKPISVVFSGIPNDDNGETTGIIEITEDENGNSVFSVTPIQGVYNINGQKMGNDVRNLPKGMYIINGKKYNVQ